MASLNTHLKRAENTSDKRYGPKESQSTVIVKGINRIADTYQRIAGGVMSWDSIILTGGGSALLHKRLLPILDHENIILAEEIKTIHLANVRGGLKLWRLYEALQLL